MKGFCGHLKDETKLKKCASGGFATALYEKIGAYAISRLETITLNF